jgi:hypothetical protein
MNRRLLGLLLLSLALACVSACNFDWDVPSIATPFSAKPKLGNVPQRLALGATAVALVEVLDPDTIVTATNPDIVAVRRISATRLELTGVGVGETSVSLQEGSWSIVRPIEVAEHDRYEVLLVEEDPWTQGPLSMVAPHRKALLSDVPQRFVVTYHDSRGPLLGKGLADFALVPSTDGCDIDPSWPFDAQCLVFEPGPHLIRIKVAGHHDEVIVTAVPEEEIVDLLLPRTDENDAEPGDLLRVDALGLSGRGTPVYGIHPVFDQLLPSLAYEYDPSAPLRRVTVTALGFERELTYRGHLSFPDSLWRSCKSYWLDGCSRSAPPSLAP